MRSLLLLPLLLGLSFSTNAKSETYYIDVSAERISDYILSGNDKNGSVSGNDSTITVNEGDAVIFDIDAFKHPFYIKTEFSRGIGNHVTTRTLSVTPGN